MNSTNKALPHPHFETADLIDQGLQARKQAYKQRFLALWTTYQKESALAHLKDREALAGLERLTTWMDGWVCFSWDFVQEETLMLIKSLAQESSGKLSYLNGLLPAKALKAAELTSLLFLADGTPAPMDPAEYAYYNNLLQTTLTDKKSAEAQIELIEETLPQIKNYQHDPHRFTPHFALIARGGYGRRELSFASDVDLAYLVDLEGLGKLDRLVLQEQLKRLSELFVEVPLEVASQYFELGEDLERFSQTEALHAIPSLLEARLISGNAKLLDRFKKEVRAACPTERMVRFLNAQVAELKLDRIEELTLKEGRGGLRHLQFALWMVVLLTKPKKTDTFGLLGELEEKGWLTPVQRAVAIQSLETIWDLRNFMGLYEQYRPILESMGEKLLAQEKLSERFTDRLAMAYLKLKHRFTQVDQLDLNRLNASLSLATLADKLIAKVLDRMHEERLPGFLLVKHLGSNQIRKLWDYNRPERAPGQIDEELFLDWNNLFALFGYLANNGNDLAGPLAEGLANLLSRLYKKQSELPKEALQDFVFHLFSAEHSAEAVKQMMDIALPIENDQARTLLGLFLPEVNQMRYLLRNLEVHQYPLCIHSQKALARMELEIVKFRRNEPELWRFIGPGELFALKWSIFFHDLGKINLFRDHEQLGPKLSGRMLDRLGFDVNSDLVDLIRLLVQHHQSMVRFSKLSTHLDLGLLKFFELAQRDPRKLILLYLVNISDFKSVSEQMADKAGHLDEFFQRVLSILEVIRHGANLTQTINEFLDQKVEEQKEAVIRDLLLHQACNRSLDEVLLEPLRLAAPKISEQLLKNRSELSSAVHYLALGELDPKSLDKHYQRFSRILADQVPKDQLFNLARPYSSDWHWFFTAIPNRYLLSASPQQLTRQLLDFDNFREQTLRFSFIKGSAGEYDSLLFYANEDPGIQAKIAFALNSKGINLELAKINRVVYLDGSQGVVGFFQGVSLKGGEISVVELESMVLNLHLPDMGRPSWVAKHQVKLQVSYFLEREKGYQVTETEPGQFLRQPVECWAVKVSMLDTAYAYFKIMMALASLGVTPIQVTVTTIGNQLVDYFYVSAEEKQLLEDKQFDQVLAKFLDSEIHQ